MHFKIKMESIDFGVGIKIESLHHLLLSLQQINHSSSYSISSFISRAIHPDPDIQLYLSPNCNQHKSFFNPTRFYKDMS